MADVQTFLVGGWDEGHHTAVGVSADATPTEAIDRAHRELDGCEMPPHILRVEPGVKFYRVRDGDPDADWYGHWDSCDPFDDGAVGFYIVKVIPMMLSTPESDNKS